MPYLLFTSLLWGLSFGLIKAEVSDLNPFAVSFIRLSLSALVFLPLLRTAERRHALPLAGVGLVQFGLMYCLYISAYQFLQGHQIAILTITTPLFVVLIDGLLERRLHPRYWAAAALAIAGGLALVYDPDKGISTPAWTGLLLIQAANLCFALGQLLYRRAKRSLQLGPDHRHFAWLYLGALVVPLIAGLFVGPDALTIPARPSQWMALAYLGLIPSGLGFFLWNKGVTQVNAGTAAVFNNLKIPSGVLVAWLIFSEPMAIVPVLISLTLLAVAVFVARPKAHSHSMVAGGLDDMS